MSGFRRINFLALCLCFVVVVFGAYVRLSNAGLGCPDWPGCYGQATVPEAPHEIARAEQAYPQRPVEAPKAWKEMIHRYLVGGLSVLIVTMLVMALVDRGRRLPLRLTLTLVGVILVQIVFGALTVTLKVHPLVVTTHLLLGLTTLSLLWWQWLTVSRRERAGDTPSPAPRNEREAYRAMRPKLPSAPPAARLLGLVALLALSLQIFLGGWTSTNYAAPSCPDFPTCQGAWLPPMNFKEAFTLSRGFNRNYEFGLLDNTARATIHVVHRFGAAVVGSLLIGVALYLLAKAQTPLWRRLALALLGAVVLQITIGISLVLSHFRLWLGDAHNAGAALLLLTVLAVNFFAWPRAD